MWLRFKQPLVGEGALRDEPKQRLRRRLHVSVPLKKKRTTFENRCIMHCKPLNKFTLCMPMDCVSGDV